MSAHTRRLRLREIIATHNLTDEQVGKLVGRTAGYVRELRHGNHPVSYTLLRLLELELEHGEGRALIVSRAAV
jgi:hypothetical protein